MRPAALLAQWRQPDLLVLVRCYPHLWVLVVRLDQLDLLNQLRPAYLVAPADQCYLLDLSGLLDLSVLQHLVVLAARLALLVLLDLLDLVPRPA